MKKIASFFACLLFLCAFVDARAPLESYKRYMIVLVHGIGENTMIPHDYEADPEKAEKKDAPRKSSIWDSSKDDILSENWFGNIGGTLQSRGLLGHVVWYDFYEPWKSPIYGDGRYGVSLSRYLGDRDIVDNPMGLPHDNKYFGRTAQSYWLHEFFPTIVNEANNNIVTYEKYGKNSFLQLAQTDWGLWNQVQQQAGINNEETPKKYILIAHSMGGLTTRDYITGNFYKGDVDKLITLDSPHEGSAIANYVQYWKQGRVNNKIFVAEFTADIALMCLAFHMSTNPATATMTVPSLLASVAAWTWPMWYTTVGNFLGNKFAGYNDVENPDTGLEEDHSAYGIDVMALNDGNKYGLYQSDTKDFLKNFNNRTSLVDNNHNGYQLPYFRLVSTSGVPTPGGPGFHQFVNNQMLNFCFFSTLMGGVVPYVLDGEDGVFSNTSAVNVLFKAVTALMLSSLWNDWGSGFVPHWSGEAKNVKIFNDPKADTKRWNISFDGDNNNLLGGFVPFLLGLGATEVVAQLLPWENAGLKTLRYLGYAAAVGAYVMVTDKEKLQHLPSMIGFHGAMAKKVDENRADGHPTKGGALKRVIDDLLWEKPSVSIVYNPVDPQDRSNSQGGRVGISTTKENVEYTKTSVTTNANGESVVDVKWKGETSPHIFDLSLPGAFDANGNELPKTVNVVGKHVNTTIKGVVLNKTDGSKSIRIDNSNCGALASDWTVVKENEGNWSCNIPVLSNEEKGNYTMQLVVGAPSDANATYGVMVDVDRVPGVAFVEGPALINAQDNDWDRYVTFKSRRKQVDANGNIDVTIADMVDYRRASNLVVNKLPRLIEFEVDDLQPDRMNRLSVDFNYGTAKIEFEAVKDPNNFNIAPNNFDANAVSHGFVNTADEEYTLKMSLGSTSCQATVKNPVNAWGKWILNLDELSATCKIDKYQPFLEGQNHIRIFSENRWLMTRSQDLNIFIPGPPPTISLVYPRDGEVFCGSSKLEFETNLIYALSSPFTANDVSIYYMNGNQRVDINANELDVVQKPDFGSITKYSVSTKNKIAWPEETAVSITVRPKILGNSSTPYTYMLHISQDCVAPTVTISDEQEKYNPTTISFESFDQSEVNGEHLSVQDEIIEIKSQDGSFSKVLSANKFTTFGPKIRSIELKDNAGNDLPDGSYELSVRVHDDVVKDATSDVARREFWESYQSQPDMSKPFATYCNDGVLTNASSCMTHWRKDTKEIIIDRTAPTIENTEFVLKQGNQEFVFDHNRYMGSATDKDLVLKMTVSDANLNAENVPEASVEFVQIDFIGQVVQNGYRFAQKMEGKYENGKFVYNHDVIKALTEDLKNAMNGQQPIPDGIYASVIKVADAAKNVAEKPLSSIFVDMTAPKITELSVPYTVKSGMVHLVTFKADEIDDDPSVMRLGGGMNANVTAECGNRTISYGQVSSVEVDSKTKFDFEAVIPADVQGACLAKVEVADGNGNIRKAELSFVVDFIPPEITYPEKSNNGNAPELYGRVVIRGSAGNPNLRAGGSFTKYELSYAEINEESIVVGNWEHLGMTVPEGRRCNNPSNVSCSAVDKIGAGDDILGYWDLSKLPDNAKGKTYRIKVETFNEGGYSESDYVDVFVPAGTKSMPSITISESTPNQCDFTDKDATCNIHWNTEFPLERKNGQVRMEILRTNTKSQTTFVDVERIFRNVIPKEYFSTPNNTSAKGAYLWIDRNDLNKDENVYHLRLVAGQSATTYTILFSKTKNAVVKIFADGNNTEDLAQSSGEQYSSLTVALNAGESRSYVVKNDTKSQIAWNLQGSTVRTGDDASNIRFMYTQDPNQDELAFVGQNSTPLLSMLKQSEVFLPLTSAAEQFIWDGKNDALASVPSGSYRVILTLEGLEDGVYDVASKDITVIGKPVILSNVDATPKQVPFDVSYLEKSILKPVNVTFTFNIDQDAIVSAFVRSTDGKEPTRELMKLEENGRKTLLDQFYLAGRKENYQVNWDGKYNNTSQALPGNYEFVVQILEPNGEITEKKVAFTITDEHMLVDGDVVLRVDGRDDPNNHLQLEGQDFQVVEGMNDAILQFAPAGKTVVTDQVTVEAKYNGTQKISALPFERYSVGVQVHRTKASFWVVGAMSFRYNDDDDYVGTSCGKKNGYSNRFRYYGDANGPYELTFTENGGAQPVYINFDSGEDGTDKYGKMSAVNTTLFLIPTYLKSKTEIKKMFGWTSELEMLGRVIGKSWYELTDVQYGEDDKAAFDARYESFKEDASTVIVWGPQSGSIFVGGGGYGDGFGITTYKGNRDTPIVPDGGRTPSYNSSDYYWDKRCDVGNNPAMPCFDHDVSDAELRQFCADHPAKGCGNGIADEGEPLLGTTDRYLGTKHSAEFLAEAWAWRNYNGEDEVFDPDGCVGESYTRHNVMLIASLAPHPRFWGTNGIAYGNGNLVNRYLTLDPMNENFLFCDACDFSTNKTPYLNPLPQHSQRFELVHSDVKTGIKSGQYFIQSLHNPNFQMFHEKNDGSIEYDNALQPDVQLIFHYFQIMPNRGDYPVKPYYLDAIISQPGIGDFPYALETRGGYAEGGHSTLPISMGGFSGLGASASVGVMFNSPIEDPLAWTYSFNFGIADHQIDAPWPLVDESSIQPSCGSNGCGSDINDLEPYIPRIPLETENVECKGAACYKVYSANVTLGSQGLDNGFDIQRHLSGWGSSIIADNPMVVIENVDVNVPAGYKLDGSIVRKDEPGCDNNGCDYIANQDPLIYNADFDDDGRISEDGSVVSLGKRDAYDGSLDSDKDLAMGEDPDNAFRIRLNDMTFDFEAGASSQANWREYKLGDLAGAKLTELQRRDMDRGYLQPGTVAEKNSVFKQISSDEWTDNPLAKTHWVNLQLFYKDGKVNNDVKIVKTAELDNDNAMLGEVWIAPNDFNGRDRRLLEVHATIPGMQAGEDYKLYASSEIGWIDLTPSTRVTPNAQGFDGLLAYWDVETSGMHQLMLVRTVGSEKKYKAINVFVGAVANDGDDKTLFSDAMGRSQVEVASGSPRVDVIPLGKDEVPQIIPSNKNVGPVVKIYPAVSTLKGNVDLRLRFNRTEVKTNGWTDNGTMYVVSDGYSPQPVDGLTFEFYDENDHKLPEGRVNLSSPSGWSYVIISGTVNNTENNEHKMPKQASVQLGESATLDDATVSVTETSDGVYNVDFNLDANP